MFNLYQEIIMDHYRNPRNYGILKSFDFKADQRNSSCGDEISFTGTIKDSKLDQLHFEGKGCVISQATASLLTEKAKNMDLESILSLDKDDVTAMLGMPLGPIRILCALLSLTALQNGIKSHRNI